MLVAQMVSVHVMAMRCAHHLANGFDGEKLKQKHMPNALGSSEAAE